MSATNANAVTENATRKGKPKSGADAQLRVVSTIEVVTDSRTYSFLLAPAYGPMPDLPFTVRIKSAAPAIATIDANGPTKVEEGLYKLSGSRALRPAAMSDDGVHT